MAIVLTIVIFWLVSGVMTLVLMYLNDTYSLFNECLKLSRGKDTSHFILITVLLFAGLIGFKEVALMSKADLEKELESMRREDD